MTDNLLINLYTDQQAQHLTERFVCRWCHGHLVRYLVGTDQNTVSCPTCEGRDSFISRKTAQIHAQREMVKDQEARYLLQEMQVPGFCNPKFDEAETLKALGF